MGDHGSTAPARARAVGPYIGLSYYTEADAEWFFGRDRERDTIVDNLRTARLTVFYAPSGVGKSSLLRAGVMPELRALANHRRTQADLTGYLPVVFSSWKDDPVEDLVRAVGRTLEPILGPNAQVELTGGLACAIAQAAACANAELLIILDQFEEYLLYRTHEPPGRRFVDELAACVNNPKLDANFLIGIREDAYPALGDLFAGRLANVYGNYFQLEHLDRDAARTAIVQPIAHFNELHPSEPPVEIEPQLVERVLDEVRTEEALGDRSSQAAGGGDNGARARRDEVEAPYLQLVMSRLWEHTRQRRSGVLRLAALEELGGAGEIVRTHLDGALDALAPQDYDTALELFRYLVTPSGNKIVFAAADLAELVDRPYDRVAGLLVDLAGEGKRIVRHVPPPAGRSTPADRYELFHDVLAPAIVDWRRRALERRRRAQAEHELERLEHERCEAEERTRAEARRRRAFQRLAAAALALLLVAIALGVLALVSRNDAVSNLHSAQAAELVSRSEETLPSDPELSTAMALRALAIKASPQAEEELRVDLPELQELKTMRIGSPVDGVAFGPHGRELAAASEGGAASVWDLATGKRLENKDFGAGPVESMAFSRDGVDVAVGTEHGEAILWNVRSGEQKVLYHGAEAVTGVAFSPNGEHVAIGTKAGTASIWDVRSGARVTGFPREAGAVNDVAFSPNGKQIAVAYELGQANVWSVGHTSVPAVLRDRGAGVESVAFSPNDASVVTASTDGTARVWETASGREALSLPVSGGAVLSAAFSPDGSAIVTASQDRTAEVWSAATGERLLALAGSEGPVRDAVFDPTGAELATASADGTVRIWEAAPRERLAVLRGRSGAVIDASFNRAGTMVVTANQNNSASIWDLATGKRTPLEGDTEPVYSAVFNPAGSAVLTASIDGTARIWNANTGGLLSMTPSDGEPFEGGAFNADASEVVTAGKDGVARIWKVTGGARMTETKQLEPHAGSMESAAFNPAGTRVVTANRNGTATIFTLSAPKRPHVLPVSGAPVLTAAFDPSGREVLTAGRDGVARIWDADSGELLMTFPCDAGPIYGAAFNRDGDELVTASQDGELQIWDTRTGRQLTSLSSNEGLLYSAAFDIAGNELVTGSQGGDAAIWSTELAVDTPSLERIAERRLSGLTHQQRERYLPR